MVQNKFGPDSFLSNVIHQITLVCKNNILFLNKNIYIPPLKNLQAYHFPLLEGKNYLSHGDFSSSYYNKIKSITPISYRIIYCFFS